MDNGGRIKISSDGNPKNTVITVNGKKMEDVSLVNIIITAEGLKAVITANNIDLDLSLNENQVKLNEEVN